MKNLANNDNQSYITKQVSGISVCRLRSFLTSLLKASLPTLVKIRSVSMRQQKEDSMVLRGASLVVQMVRNLPAMWETQVQSLGREDPQMATHSSVLAQEIPWTESLAGYSPWGCKGVGHDWKTTQQCQLRASCCTTNLQKSFILHNRIPISTGQRQSPFPCPQPLAATVHLSARENFILKCNFNFFIFKLYFHLYFYKNTFKLYVF